SVACWGDNSLAELGDGTTNPSALPVLVNGLSDATAISAGQNATCAVRKTGQVFCWGSNDWGKLGVGNNDALMPVPTPVVGLSDAVQVSVGQFHTCAVRSNGEVACWGFGSNGALGDGASTTSNVPVTVQGLTDAVQVTAGGLHSCAIHGSGAVTCWGDNSSGQIGPLTNGLPTQPVPVEVGGSADIHSGFVTLDAGRAPTCAVSKQSVTCWGDDTEGQLGGGSVTITGGAFSIGAGAYHTCVTSNSLRGAWCWGRGSDGQLGNGAGGGTSSPVAVSDSSL